MVAHGQPTPCVLFVDDEQAVLDGIRRSLRKEPIEVLTATSPAEALAILASRPVDVVVSDERMPGGSGAVLLSDVRDQYPRAVRIMLTGEANLAQNIKVIEEGGLYRFLSKPLSSGELIRTLRHALQLRDLGDLRSRLDQIAARGHRQSRE